MRETILCFIILSVIILTTGCGNNKTLECESVEKDGTVLKYKVDYKDDVMVKVRTTYSQTYESEELAQSSQKLSEKLLQQQYGDKKGVTFKTTVDGKSYSMVVTYDIEKMSEETMSDLQLSRLTYDNYQKNLEEQGYTCQ